MLVCPHCGKEAKTERGMIKHLTGTLAYGGHELSVPEAHATVNRIRYPANQDEPFPLPDVMQEAIPNFIPSGDFLRDLMMSIACNKALPKYQFERRVDAMLALFLPGIFSKLLDWNVAPVVPEFPIKSLENNQTTNVDGLFFRKETPASNINAAWIFFELKTDSASFSQRQLTTYLDAKKRGMKALRTELSEVLRATRHRKKYKELFRRLDQNPVDAPIEIVYLVPGNRSLPQQEGVRLITFPELEKITIPDYSEAWNLFKETIVPLFS